MASPFFRHTECGKAGLTTADGISLVELVTTLGVASLLALVLTTILNNMYRGMTVLNQSAHGSDLRNLIEMTLSSPDSCQATIERMGGVRLATSSPGNPVPAIWQRQVNESGPPTDTLLLRSGGNYPIVADTGALRNVEFGIYAVPPVVTNATNIPAYFTIRYAVTRRDSSSALQQVIKSVPITLATDQNGNVVSCSGASVAFCKKLNGTYDPQRRLCTKIDLSPLASSGNWGAIRARGFSSKQGTSFSTPPSHGYFFSGDAGSGMFSPPGGGTLALGVSSQEVLRVRGGNVGIKTINPLSTLAVNGAMAVGGFAGTLPSAPAESLIIEGGVGIGELNPNNKLSAQGNATFLNNSRVAIRGGLGGGTPPETALDVDGKIYMRRETATGDPDYTAVTKEYAFTTLFASKGACPNGSILRGFNSSGASVCGRTDAITRRSCPPGRYLVGYDGSGSQVCVALASMGTCGYQQYLAGVDTAGRAICKTLSPLGLCPAGQAMQGINAGGNMICINKMDGGNCPGRVVAGITTFGTVTCTTQQNGGLCPTGKIALGITGNGSPICGDLPVSGTLKPLYQCPRMDTGCGNGTWWSQGCVGQLSTNTTSCQNITMLMNSVWCAQNYACPLIGSVRVQ